MRASAAMAAPAVRRPAVPNVVLGTALFVFTEVMLFGGLASAYLVLRGQAGPWPPPDQPRLPVAVTGLNTVLLLLSGVAAWRGVAAARQSDARGSWRLMALALGLGAAFLVIQGLEWLSLLRYGLTSSSSLYGSLFYTLVGCHGVHLMAAVVVLAIVLVRRAPGRAAGTMGADSLSALLLYWTFVVAAWPPLYVLVYLW